MKALTSTVATLLLSILQWGALAQVYVPHRFYSVDFDISLDKPDIKNFLNNPNFQSPVTPLAGVKIFGYVSLSSDYSILSGPLWPDQPILVEGSSTTLTFPKELQSPFGYVFFIVKEGYIPHEARATWVGAGNADEQKIVLNRYSNPSGAEQEHAVRAMIITTPELMAWGAFVGKQALITILPEGFTAKGGTVESVPMEVARFYEYPIVCKLDIATAGRLVYSTEVEIKESFATENFSHHPLQFEWTPSHPGVYSITARVEALPNTPYIDPYGGSKQIEIWVYESNGEDLGSMTPVAHGDHANLVEIMVVNDNSPIFNPVISMGEGGLADSPVIVAVSLAAGFVGVVSGVVFFFVMLSDRKAKSK